MGEPKSVEVVATETDAAAQEPKPVETTQPDVAAEPSTPAEEPKPVETTQPDVAAEPSISAVEPKPVQETTQADIAEKPASEEPKSVEAVPAKPTSEKASAPGKTKPAKGAKVNRTAKTSTSAREPKSAEVKADGTVPKSTEVPTLQETTPTDVAQKPPADEPKSVEAVPATSTSEKRSAPGKTKPAKGAKQNGSAKPSTQAQEPKSLEVAHEASVCEAERSLESPSIQVEEPEAVGSVECEVVEETPAAAVPEPEVETDPMKPPEPAVAKVERPVHLVEPMPVKVKVQDTSNVEATEPTSPSPAEKSGISKGAKRRQKQERKKSIPEPAAAKEKAPLVQKKSSWPCSFCARRA